MKNRLLKSAVAAVSIAFLAAFTLVNFSQDKKIDKHVNDDPSRPLLENIQQLVKGVQGQKTVWVGYKLNVREKFKNSNMRFSYNHGHSQTNIHDDSKTYTTEKNLFYKFSGDKKNPSGLLLQQDFYKDDLSGYIIWIDGVSTARSLEAAMALHKSNLEEEHYFLGAIAFHPGDKAADYLYQTALAEKNQEKRKDAIFWYAQTIEGEGLGRLPELEGSFTTTEDKLALIFAYSTLENMAAFNKIKNIALTSTDKEIVKQSIFWLGQFEKIDATEELKTLFRSKENNDIRNDILFSIAQKETKESGDFLMEIATSSADLELKKTAVFWLSQYDEIEVLPLFKQMYKQTEDPDFKENLLFSISQIDDGAGFEFLSEIAMGNDPEKVRANAVFFLCQCDDEKKALALLKRIFQKEENVEMRKRILFSAAQLHGAEVVDYIADIVKTEKSPEVLKDAVFFLSQVDDESKAVRTLASLYRSESGRELKESIIFALAQCDDKEAMRKLLDIAKTEKDTELKKEALFWLSQSSGNESADYIETVLEK